jgi:hypothetical protein
MGKRGIPWGSLALLATALVCFMAFWGTVFYVAWHFIAKFW